MAVSVEYNKIGKWIAADWSTLQVYYGADFNPSPFTRPSRTSVTATNVATSFDLDWFQPWHEVWCWVFVLSANASYSGTLWGDFERYNWSWSFAWDFSWDLEIDSWTRWAAYMYFWVDEDEIRSWYSKYRIHYYTVDNTVNFYSPEFTISNLSIDSWEYRSWYLWVEWRHLCYTDATLGSRWYKHKIAYDNNYSTLLGGSEWYIWLDENDNLRIYYVDEYWTKRRTYSSDYRYDGNVNVWSGKKWFMRVSDWDMEDGYGHLCFVAPNWSKRRILNWPPAWYV